MKEKGRETERELSFLYNFFSLSFYLTCTQIACVYSSQVLILSFSSRGGGLFDGRKKKECLYGFLPPFFLFSSFFSFSGWRFWFLVFLREMNSYVGIYPQEREMAQI